MRNNRAFFLLVVFAIAVTSGYGSGQAAKDGPARFQVSRLSPRLLLVTDTKMNNNIAAVRTSRGVVVVDTDESIEAGRAVRRIIEREFPGEAFAFVINTHSHWDHVLGNPAFSEATILAHENCRRAMMKVGERTPSAPEERGRESASEKAPSAGQLPPPPPALGQVGVAAEFLEATLPDVTFTDRMTLHCGGRGFRLIHFGNAHTPSDILVLVPEEKTLFVGDLFFKGGLPGFNEWLAPEVERWRAVLDEVLRDPGEVENIVSGHGGIIPPADLEIQVRYAFDLWDGVSRAFREGRSLKDVRRDFAIRTRYPDLEPRNIKDSLGRTIHDENIRKIWKHLTSAPPDGVDPCTDGSRST
jgi:glyoxylase-like metal-dependent hydrolase (beta-lactamase superfamily II)